MRIVGSYLVGGQVQTVKPANPSDGAGPVLDAIDGAGPDGAEIGELARVTDYDDTFLYQVLRELQGNGMATKTANGRYQLTELGVKARYLVAR